MPKIDDAKKADRQDQILNAALDLFSTRGYTETSMNDIVRASGISKGGIYVYFPSKEAIFMAIADRTRGIRHGYMAAVPQNAGAAERLAHYIRSVLTDYTKAENIGRVRFSFEFWLKHADASTIGSVDKGAYIRERYHHFEKDLKDLIEAGQVSGEFSARIDVSHLPWVILTAIDGMAFTHAMLENPMTAERIETFVETILRSLRQQV